MFQNLEIFRQAQAMSAHAGARQALVAQNVANADTPGYKARDLTNFADSYRADTKAGQLATRRLHLNGMDRAGQADVMTQNSIEVSPNGNGVSVEEEMLRGVSVERQHNRALAIYKSSLGILRSSLGRG
jgi:flagellar basal-body rod protein FlgB